MTDVKKSEIYPVFGCEICFMAIYAKNTHKGSTTIETVHQVKHFIEQDKR